VSDETRLSTPVPPEGTGQVVLYRTEDGRTRINVKLIQESVWLTLNQIADLFQRDKSVISKHIKNIFETGELDLERTVAKFATFQTEGGRSVTREIEFYRLEAILAVGYRVKSARGTQFRQWATAQLQQYLVKGFAMDDDTPQAGRRATASRKPVSASLALHWRPCLLPWWSSSCHRSKLLCGH